MPIFDYKCPQCGTVKEKLVKRDDPAPLCEKDNTPMEQQIAANWKFTFTNGKGTSGGNTIR